MDNWNKQNWIKNILSKSGTEIEKVNGNFINAFYLLFKKAFPTENFISCSFPIFIKNYSVLFVKLFEF